MTVSQQTTALLSCGTAMPAPDFRALCAELVETLSKYQDRLEETYHPDSAEAKELDAGFGVLEHARAALAQPKSMPTDDELRECIETLRNQWIRTVTSGGEDPDSDDFDVAIARAVLARWGRPVASPAGDGLSLGVLGPLIAWLTEEATQAADKDCPKTAGMLTWAAQVVGERVDEDAPWGNLAPAPKPIPVSERLPGEGDCDAEGMCWLFSKVESEWRLLNVANPGVPHLKYCFSHWLPASAIPLPQARM